MPKDIRLIALDLDGTLLNSKKELTDLNRAALERAARSGIHIVPTTGRFFGGMPQTIRDLPFIRYAITINGAQVYDRQEDRAIARTEIPVKRATELMAHLDQYPLIYDCFMDNWGWMTQALWDRAEEFAPNEHYATMIRQLRKPVPELKAYLLDRGQDVQKVQFFAKDMELRAKLMEELPGLWPDIAVTSSVPNNVELNQIEAHKGRGLAQLAAHLGLDMSQTMALGDGLNDLTMLREAGLGVAMANACPEALEAADVVTHDCDHDGVGKAILKYCFDEEV